MSWDGLKEKRPIPARSIDGYVRTDEEERNLNKTFAGVFKNEDGKKILEYIKSITTEAVAGQNIESNGLFHLEGMRFLAGVIQTRIKKVEKDGRW